MLDRCCLVYCSVGSSVLLGSVISLKSSSGVVCGLLQTLSNRTKYGNIVHFDM